MVGIPGDTPQKGCPANSEFRTGYRDKSPQDTTRGLELRFLPIMYDFIPEFFAGYARSIVKKGAEGIPSGRREGQKSRTTESGAEPAAGNSRQGSEKRAERKKRSAPPAAVLFVPDGQAANGAAIATPSACPAGDSREKIARLPGTIQG